jgi:hypothetical protein
MLTGALLAGAAGSAAALPISASSYDMKNGDNSSPGTSLRDDGYSGGTGNPATPYANLAGGLGDLTDGAIAPGNWNLTPLPFVGWRDSFLPSPTITFHFADLVNLDQVGIHINKGYSPSSVDFTMGGVSRNVPVNMGLTGAANDWVLFRNLDLAGDSLIVRLNDRAPDSISRDWILISEVTFDGVVIPEPTTLCLVAGGLLAVGAARRSRMR